MPDSAPDLAVRDNPEQARYEVDLDGNLGVIQYQLSGDTIAFTHTEVPEALEGRGIAGAMARFALEDARSRGLRVAPRCPFVAGYIRRHPEYAGLVGEGQ